ncbi:hypothetical protein ARALYDRAFT_487630, partial [Arabidopsis lyrata subsp. lyrata]
RLIDPSLNANLKTYSTQQSVDPERGQSSNSQHGLNFTQQPMRSDYSRSVLREHQQSINGYMHGNLMLQASPDRHKTPMRFDMGESPVNYDFFGGQQQLNNQLPGMLQPFPRQQMTFNDMQLLKQHAMVKQMHEYQMQQQLQKQQLEARHLNSFNSNAVNGSRSSDSQSHPSISGVPLQDASNNWLQPDLMTGNTNWMHRGISPIVQSSSSGLVITPEHGHANLMAQQFETSLYGMPVGGTDAPQNAFSSVQMNMLAAQHGSANMSSSLTNQPASFLNQDDVQDSHMLPRSTYQENLFSHLSSVPGSNNVGSFQQDNSGQQNISGQEEFGQMEGSGLSEKSFMKVPENINTLQKSTTLDPTEEKILFGSDDNLWEAFGNSTDMSLTGNLMSSSSDLFDACPSLQSGSWSALMQSAVAETSSDDAGVHEWGSKQQSVWANNITAPHADSRIGNRAQESGLNSDSTRSTVQHLQDKGNMVSDHGLLEKTMTQQSQMAGNMFHSLSSGIDQNNSCSIGKNEDIDDRLGDWKAASNPNSAALMEQKNHLTQNLQWQREIYGTGNDSSASRDIQKNIQQHLDNNSVSPESLTQVNAHDFSVLPGGKETQSPSRSDSLVRVGFNHKESANYMLHFGQTVSQSFFNKNHGASAGADHLQISPQIAPSMYSQYEAFKNGLVQPMNDTGRFTLMKIGERYSNLGNSDDGLHSVQLSKQSNTADPGYVVHIQQMSGSTPGVETLSSTSLPHGATDQLLKVDKPKKRKTASSGLLSWNKEVMQGPQRLKTLGEAEVDWARATNRFAEKVEFATLLEDGPPTRSKRRLIYTTQLMQQLFRPLPDRVKVLVASSNYEFVTYTAARAALGDACSSTSTDRVEGFSPPNNSNPLSERTETEKMSDQYISKAAEDFISRTKKLETDFAGLEKGTTITDLRVEVQDLERFAVINRFASFHQSSSSMDRSVSSLRLNPQRYVTVAPMPRHIPDRVQCLSF